MAARGESAVSAVSGVPVWGRLVRVAGGAAMINAERLSDGKLAAFTSIGCYPIYYLTEDGGVLCPACANGEHGSEASEDSAADKQWHLIACDVHWEGEPLSCDHCNEQIESAYGDPDASTAGQA